jgi:hypothetical protein
MLPKKFPVRQGKTKYNTPAEKLIPPESVIVGAITAFEKLESEIIFLLTFEFPQTTQGRHPVIGLFKGIDEYNGMTPSFP